MHVVQYLTVQNDMMAMQLSEQDLAQIKANVLLCKRKELVDNVDPRRHLTYLRSKFVLDERDCDEVKSAQSRQASTEIFLDILARKGQAGYDGFTNALLYEETQIFLLRSLTNTLELLKAKVSEEKGNLRGAETQCWISAGMAWH